MMKSRKLAIGLLLMLAVVVTTGSFAYWASSVNVTSATDTATVTIGSADPVTTTINLGSLSITSGADLTPLDGENQMVFSIDATFADPGSIQGTTGTLLVTEEYADMTTGGTLNDAALDLMFSTSYSYSVNPIPVGGSSIVTITVTFFAEPGTKAIYENLVQNDLVLNLTFAITVN